MPIRLVTDEPHRGRIVTALDIRGRQVRAGDRREPLELDVDASIAGFLAAAGDEGLEYSCAVSLGLERLLTLAALRGVGIDSPTARKQLNAAGDDVRIVQAKNGQDAGYLRRLGPGRATRAQRAREEQLTVAIPGRLVDRVQVLPSPWQLHARNVPEMIRWEIAAIARGHTMTEWAALTLLAATAHPAGS